MERRLQMKTMWDRTKAIFDWGQEYILDFDPADHARYCDTMTLKVCLYTSVFIFPIFSYGLLVYLSII